jgi:hypothetical protein
MTETARNTAYCGLFCQDCIPSNRAFFESVRDLQGFLNDLGFEHYAALKARGNDAFNNYEAFAEVLAAIGRLQCSRPCREGGGGPKCRVRECCLGKGYAGCWECGGSRECGLLQGLRNFHGDNIDHNLEAIGRYGVHGWSEHRGKHYPWS